eukprot:57438_1
MSHLHRNGLVHRDLKTLNLLVDDDLNGHLFLRICDFGSSRSVDLDQYYQEYSQQQSMLSFASTAYTTFTNDIMSTTTDKKTFKLNLSPAYGATTTTTNTKVQIQQSSTPPYPIKKKKKSSTTSSLVGKLKNSAQNIFSTDSRSSPRGNNDDKTPLYYNDNGLYQTRDGDGNDDDDCKDGPLQQHQNDMSLTSHLLHQVTSQMSTIVGSVQFLAPEILQNIEFKPNSRSAKSKGNSLYGFSADVYSYGCVMWETVTRREIYKGKSYAEIQKFVLNNNRPLVLGSELQNCADGNFIVRLMNQCWQSDALSRPNFNQILQMLEDRRDKFIKPTPLK